MIRTALLITKCLNLRTTSTETVNENVYCPLISRASYTRKGADLGQHRVLDDAADTFIAEQLQLVGFNPRVSDEGDGGGAAL